MVTIKLPNPNEITNIKHFLKQMELAIHHAQKAYEVMEKEGELTEDAYITYRQPNVNLYQREQDGEGYVKVHVDEESEGFKDIELEINP